MKLDHKKYTPILKWKRAEQSALRDLSDSRKDVVVPLIEFVMPKPKGLPSGVDIDQYRNAAMAELTDSKIDSFVSDIEKAWGKRLAFIDFTYIYPEIAAKVSERVINAAYHAGLSLIPSVNLAASKEFKSNIIKIRNQYGSNIAIRISSVDLADIDVLNKRLNTYLGLPGSSTDKTHLIIDLKDITDVGIYARLASAAQAITHLDEWSSFILASGAFPVDLSQYKLEDDNEIIRQDWLNWKKHVATSLHRIPTFADYGIRHPVYIESSLLLFPTASIKYTLSDKWKLIKGKKQRYENYLAGAAIIENDKKIFYGKDFSAGDSYIAKKAEHLQVYLKDNSVKGTGSTESWLSAGFNHHMSVAADQVSS